MEESAPLTITFRCPPELDAVLPRPIPAVEGLPGWFKAMPQKSYSSVLEIEHFTVKKCPPFLDAMTYGFLMPLVADVRVENGVLEWDRGEVPSGAISTYTRSPLGFHDNSQVAGTPFFEEDSFIIKFHNFWTVELPPGYSLLVTHPVNRQDLPFVTLTGLVDSDSYHDNFINFPARWRDPDFNGVLARGTPVAQCLPFKRDLWTSRFETITGDGVDRMREVVAAIDREDGIYRHRFRAAKR